ncbi:L-gulonolactone oxidase 3-like [Zingiber officinale]|uniref:L-gulonolactone oxidase 3-like n=1 Tax=Zingiber officinale TaxID=94328 RepID=UPI001C4C3FD7|nr:L-gulonolactone oxidase 3-like [Zingiber officinale]
MAAAISVTMLIVAIISGSCPSFTSAKPPAPPVFCDDSGCVVSNAYGAWGDRQQCRTGQAVFPTTEEELRAAVAEAHRKRFKAKAVSGFSHTIPKLACPPSENSVVISTAKYNSRIEVDVANRRVTADAGVGLRDLIDKVEAAGLSLVAAPYWEGVSIGGLISTGSHGSSWWGKGGAVHDHVESLTLVVTAPAAEGYAKVVTLRRGDPLFNAASVSLGLLGIISQVTLSLEPSFKRSITYSFQNDSTFEDQFMDHARKHEFADITWFPSQHQAAFRFDDRVPLNTSGDGFNDFIGFQSTLMVVSMAVRATEKVFDESRNAKGKCVTAATVLAVKKLMANGLKNNNLLFTGYPVTGLQGRMQTSGSCQHSPASDVLSSCAWDPRIKGLFFYETTAFFSPQSFKSFILDVKRLRDMNPDNFCGLDNYNGFMIRFVKRSESLLGQPEDSVVVDFNYYRARDPSTPRLNQDLWEEVEQMAFVKYGARPHWAKNRNVAFAGVQGKYPGFKSFLAAVKELDPEGVFQSPWSDEVINDKEAVKSDGCALEGQCICSEDRHCSPAKGYLCQHGLVYKEARVCRFG